MEEVTGCSKVRSGGMDGVQAERTRDEGGGWVEGGTEACGLRRNRGDRREGNRGVRVRGR